MATINAAVDGIVLTADSTTALNIQSGGVNAIQIAAGGATTITTPTITNPATFPAGSASAPAITTTGDTNTGVYFPAADQVAVTTGGTVAAAFNTNGLFFRNRIINGDMRIAQRGTAAVTTTAYVVDRFLVGNTTDGAFSAQQDTSAPTGSGFINSLKTTTTTADGTLASTQIYYALQRIEGTNIADLGWGTASARTVTLSFWVRSSLTGTFGGSLRNGAANRSYPFTYSISAADTWEYKTVTIPGDTTGTWLTTEGAGINVFFGLGVGSDFSGTAGAWAGTNYISATGAVSVIGTLNATWYVTGVQLETGSVATPFERRPYGTELALCQRYYYRISAPTASSIAGLGYAQSATDGRFAGNFPVTMRTRPTALEQTGTAGDYAISTGGTDRTLSAVPAYNGLTNQYSWFVSTTVASGQTAGQAGVGYILTSGAYLGWSAEL